MLRMAQDERLEAAKEFRKLADYVEKQPHQPSGMVVMLFYAHGPIETAVKITPEFGYLTAVGYLALLQKMFMNHMEIQVQKELGLPK
jgi:hypothetical protein